MAEILLITLDGESLTTLDGEPLRTLQNAPDPPPAGTHPQNGTETSLDLDL